PLERDPTLHPGIANWIERMLAKEPGERPASARAAWDELDDFVMASESSFWRRAARLDERVDGERCDASGHPLNEASFPSSAPSLVASRYFTYESERDHTEAPDPGPPDDAPPAYTPPIAHKTTGAAGMPEPAKE